MPDAQTIFVDRRWAGRTLLQLLQSALQLSPQAGLRALAQHQVRISGGVCTDPERRVKIGQMIQVNRSPSASEGQNGPRAGARALIQVRHVDDQIVVVAKPAGVTTVRHAGEVDALGPRARKHLPPSLVDLLPAVLKAEGHASHGRLRAVHRLDKETSGLVVLARTPEAERHLGKQFRAHTVGRHYLALVRGQARDERIESFLVRDRGDGRRGSGPADQGQHAVTQVRVVETLGDFTLVECRLETGRTHQVRIHLGEHGWPLCGERIYDRPLHGSPLPDTSGANRPMLHAASLAVDHPRTRKRLEWHEKPPQDMKELLKKLRQDEV
jgi:23S rRNA pseudouridine1911/1915/1917 synthase